MAQYTDNSNIIYNNVSKGKDIAKISHSNTDFDDEIVGKVYDKFGYWLDQEPVEINQ